VCGRGGIHRTTTCRGLLDRCAAFGPTWYRTRLRDARPAALGSDASARISSRTMPQARHSSASYLLGCCRKPTSHHCHRSYCHHRRGVNTQVHGTTLSQVRSREAINIRDAGAMGRWSMSRCSTACKVLRWSITSRCSTACGAARFGPVRVGSTEGSVPSPKSRLLSETLDFFREGSTPTRKSRRGWLAAGVAGGLLSPGTSKMTI